MKQKQLLLISLFSALIIVGAYLRIPLPPVPITLQTLFVLLAGVLLGTKAAISSTAIYLLLGAIGLPVFSSGGGLALLLGPTGGYLFGLLFAAGLAGIAGNYKKKEENPKMYSLLCLLFCFLATLAVYAVGVPFLKYSRSLSWKTAIEVGMIPFLLGDGLKIVAAVYLSRNLRSRIKEFLG